MPQNCCKYFTVSLVPVASLTLVVVFGLGIVLLPILYVRLSHTTKVRSGRRGRRKEKGRGRAKGRSVRGEGRRGRERGEQDADLCNKRGT